MTEDQIDTLVLRGSKLMFVCERFRNSATISAGADRLFVWVIKTFGRHASFLVPEALAAVTRGAVLLAWFVVRCVRSDAPLLDLRLLRSRRFTAGVASLERGGVLGGAILGTVSALIHRAKLSGSGALTGLNPDLEAQASGSLGAAVAIAEQLRLPALGHDAGVAFTEATQTTGVLGGIVMLAIAAVVFLTAPRGTDVAAVAH